MFRGSRPRRLVDTPVSEPENGSDLAMSDLRRRHDVVVVGARAAGAATALLLGRQGHDVVLVDRAQFPADTVSTHQIARPGVTLLNRWGLLPAVLASGAPAIRRVTFTAAGGSGPPPGKPQARGGPPRPPRPHG